MKCCSPPRPEPLTVSYEASSAMSRQRSDGGVGVILTEQNVASQPGDNQLQEKFKTSQSYTRRKLEIDCVPCIGR